MQRSYIEALAHDCYIIRLQIMGKLVYMYTHIVSIQPGIKKKIPLKLSYHKRGNFCVGSNEML